MDRRSRCLAVLVSVIAVGIARADEAGAGPGDGAEARTLEFPEHAFRLRMPAGWEHRRDDGVDGCRMRLTMAPGGRSGEGVVTLWVRDADEPAGAAEWRDLVLRHLRTRPEYRDARAGEQKVGDRTVPALEFDGTYGGKPWRARQAILDAGGLRYVVQGAAPVERFDAFRGQWEAVLAAFEPMEPSPEAAQERRTLVLAARCGEDLGWAKDWADAAARARASGRWILVYVRAYAGFRLTDQVRTLTFTDPDVVDLVRARFVPLRLSATTDSPLRSPEVYGLGPWTFGTAVLVASADGEVRADVGCLQPWALYDALRALPDPPGPRDGPGPEREGGRTRGGEDPEGRIARGDLEGALSALAGDGSDRARALRAGIHRRLRRGDEALAEIAGADGRGAGEDAALLLEEGRVLLRMGRFAGAREAFERLTRQEKDPGAANEAAYWLGALLLQGGRKAETETAWRALLADHPDDRWTWRAAGMLGSTGFPYGIGERLAWPEAAVEEATRRPEPGPLPASEARDAERGAVAWLVRHQRPDGSWTSPTEGSGRRAGPNDFTEAITALAARALWRTGPPDATPEVVGAVLRARDFLLARLVARRAHPEGPVFMDYGVWRDACVAGLLADLSRADAAASSPAAGPALRPALEEVVRSLLDRRRVTGGWSYFVTVDLGATADSTASISFVTAAAALALLDAKAAGVEVPADALSGALACLESLRRPDGTFGYMTGDPPLRGTGTPGAAGRGPLCSLALLEAGREDLGSLRHRIDLLLEHREALLRERGKSLMHTGPDGQGSHYLLYDLATAAAAVARLPDADRARYRTPLLADLLLLRSADGSFLDSPLLGRDFGAAAALLALRALAPQP